MDTVECPYCGEDVEINHDDGAHYDDNRSTPMQCPLCDKYFMVSVWISYSFEGQKADCLNDGEHSWERIRGIPKEYFENRRQCSMCGEETVIKDAAKLNGKELIDIEVTYS